ncbi:N-acetyltransferase [Nocardioides flavus (ex Wang et al. 2016)]|uniref:N-acetyltransferase n=1 Tax=Nocardioides flavus (ex Wang et al. 2016) TaxID=2058780 RepID=A0ABQ3HL88_9ACTN|nr:GNAT family N-acetyltransferase [Nocardioides flavus (ex Wang et al. 2016)]GHE17476.1 N-acetyltransferase [Nocardioides flavus (ex Wang et al. 2016)]
MITDSSVVELTSDDWAELRAIRLRALADTPDSFGVLHSEVVDLPDEAWRERLSTGHPTYVVREADATVAMAGGFAPPGSSVAWVWGMWTAPEARGRGHSTSLLDAVVRWARRLGRTPHLHVTEGNEIARRLYTRYGFEPTGEWEPLREGSHLRIEELALTRG